MAVLKGRLMKRMATVIDTMEVIRMSIKNFLTRSGHGKFQRLEMITRQETRLENIVLENATCRVAITGWLEFTITVPVSRVDRC